MAIVSDIEIRLRADIARLQQDMDRARQAVGGAMDRITSMARGAGAAIAAVAAAMGVGMFAGFIKQAIDATDAASDIAQKTGLAVEEIASLQMWFQKGGMEAGALEGSMAKLAKTMATGAEDFARLGIRTKDANGELRSTSAVLVDTAEVFANMPDGVAKTALAIELFGKSGADMIPLLNEGAAGLKAMQEAADTLGLTFDQKTVDQAGEFNDTLDMLGLAAQGTGRQMAAVLLPSLQSVAGSFLEFAQKGDLARKIAAGLGVILKVLYTIGVSVITAFTTLAKVVTGSLSLVGNHLRTIFTALKQGIEGEYTAAWHTMTSGGQNTANILRTTFSGIKEDLSKAGQAINTAWSDAGNETVAVMAAITAKGSVMTASAAKAAKVSAEAAAKQAEQYRDLLAAADERVAATAREAAGMAPLNEAQRLVADLDKQIADGKLVLSSVQETTLRQRYAEIEANMAAVESQKALVKMQEQAGKVEKELADSRADTIRTAAEEMATNQNLVRTFGMTEAAIARLEVARLKEQLAQRSSVGMTLDEIEHLEKLIVLKERSADALAERESLEEVKTFWESVDKTAHDTFVSILDGGKDLGQRLKNTLKNTFFDWLYQMTLKKWIINIQANTSGGGSLGGIMDLFSSGSGSSGGAGGGWMGMISTLKTGFSSLSSGLSSLGTTVGRGVSYIGNAMGSNSVYSFGQGMQGFTAGGAGSGISGGAASAGSAASSALSVAAAAVIGNAAGKAISNGFAAFGGSGNSTVNWGTAIGAGIGYYFGGPAVGAFLGGVIGGAVNRAFGYKKAEVMDASLQGTLSQAGFIGSNVQTIRQKGGWFRSDKWSTANAPVDAELAAMLSSAYSTLKQETVAYAQALGMSTDAITNHSATLNIKLSKDAAETQKAIEAYFAGLADSLAVTLLPTLSKFQQQGETSAAALARVVANFQAVDALLVTLGTNSQTAFRAVGVASIEARERLVALSGGIDTMATQAQFYADNFLTQAEQIAPLQREVGEQLAKLGYAGMTTTEQFKGAVQGLIESGALATAGGAATYAQLMQLAPAFKSVADYLKEVNDAAREALRNRADASVEDLQRAVDAQKDTLTRAYEEAMDALEAGIDGVNSTIERTGELSRALRQAIGTVDSPAQQAARRQAAQAQIEAAVAIARAGGPLPTADDLADALDALRVDASGQFSTLADYQREVARTNAQLEQLGGLTDEQLTTAERQLRAMQEQRDAARAAHDAEVLRLDGLVTATQAQLNAMLGVNTSVLSVTAAVEAARAAIQALDTRLATPTQSPTTGYAPTRPGPVSSAVPTPNYVAPSVTMNSEAAMLAALQNMEARMANVENNTQRAAAASAQFAQQFDAVSAGGNALAMETVPVPQQVR